MTRLVGPIALGVCLLASPAWGYLGNLQSLGQVTRDARQIVVLQVEKANWEKKVVVYKKVADLKGTHPTDEIKHQIKGGEDARESEAILQWAEPGSIALFFHNGTAGVTCIGHYWYECAAMKEAPWWTMTRGMSEMAYAYLGPTTKLRRHLAAILEGKEVRVTALNHDEVVAYSFVARKELPRGWQYPVWRTRASLAISGWPAEGLPGAGDAKDVPPLVESLRDKDPVLGAEAAYELGWIGAPAKEAVPALQKALKDPEGLVRVSAALALGQMAPDDPTALPTLIEALTDRQSKVRKAAASALGDLGSEARVAVEALGKALKDEEPRVRWSAAEALGRMGWAAEKAVPALAEALKDEAIRGVAAGALAAIGPDARASGPALAAALADADDAFRWSLVNALARVGGPDARAAVPFLVRAITGKNDTDKQCYHALILLEFLGPAGKAAARPVIDGLESRRFQPGWASTTLASIDPEAAMPILLGQLKGGDIVLRKYAAAYLGFAGPRAKDALPALTRAVKDGVDTEVSRIAAWAVELVRGDFKKAVPLLLRGVKEDKAGYNHRFCGQALEKWSTEARETVPILREALQDSNPKVRRLAAAALRRIGPDARDAIPSLRKLLRDEDRGVRAVADEALEKIQRR
jgi:HEAT repeat protein